MRHRTWTLILITLFITCYCASVWGQESTQSVAVKPLTESQLISLVSGGALPETIVTYVRTTGLAFRPDDACRTLLKTAGADSSILNALSGAKISPAQTVIQPADLRHLEELAKAGQFIGRKDYVGATKELTEEANTSFRKADADFVMGVMLMDRQSWDEAAAIYEALLQEDPTYPEAHTKYSFVLYKQDDSEGALREANAALSLTPNNAEAHKNAGLALDKMGKFDAGEEQLKQAIRIKPDYAYAHSDLGLLLDDKRDFDGAIREYRRALALGFNDSNQHYLLGIALDHKGDQTAAVNEYRESKEMDPTRFDARQNLSSDLIGLQRYPEAISELQEMEKMFPNEEVCHRCMGIALFNTRRYPEAAKEYHIAIQLDPSDPDNHLSLGDLLEAQNDLDGALKEFLIAEPLDSAAGSDFAYRAAGRIYLAKKDYVNAEKQLKPAELLDAADWYVHELYGKDLEGLGKPEAAAAEFRQAVSLNPNEITLMVEYAGALEKSGNWADAIDEYHKASLADAATDYRHRVIRSDAPDPAKQYEAAQLRLNDYLAGLRASGKSSEAATLEARIRSMQAAPSLSERLNEALQAGAKADSQRNWSEALEHYKDAVNLAEEIKPHDPRLASALDHMGKEYLGSNFAAADAAFEREITAFQEIYGPNTGWVAEPLQSLGQSAMLQRNYAAAEKYFFQAVDVDEKEFGESSDRTADALVGASVPFIVQKQYDKAEPYVLRAVHIDQSLCGAECIDAARPLATLCMIYDKSNQFDKADSCDEQLLGVLTRQYGADSPVLAGVLTNQSRALRSLGRTADADAVDKRVAMIRATTMKPN